MDATYDAIGGWKPAPPPKDKKSREEIGALLAGTSASASPAQPPSALSATGPSATGPSATGPRATVPNTTVPNTTVPNTTDPSATVPNTTVPDASRADATRSVSSVDVAPVQVRASWAAELLETDGDARALARRAATGLGLAALYGLALGAREGGAALLMHAIGVPAALIAVALVGLPALYILLALFDAPLSPRRAAGAAVRGIASSGLVLAGLAPLAALYVVTSASGGAAAIAGGLGLVLGGLLGLRHLMATLAQALEDADSATRFVAMFAQLGFGLFAITLGWRVWSGLLPLVGGV